MIRNGLLFLLTTISRLTTIELFCRAFPFQVAREKKTENEAQGRTNQQVLQRVFGSNLAIGD